MLKKRKRNNTNYSQAAFLQSNTGNMYMKKVLDLCTFLAKDYNEQIEQTEEFVRWNLPDEIGLEWIDAEYVIFQAPELRNVLSTEQCSILCEIFNNFTAMFDKDTDYSIRTHEAMQTHPFWKKQRELAKRFLCEIGMDGN